MISTPSGVKRAITRFERAADAYAFRGMIPHGESEEATRAYDDVVAEYEAAKQALLNFMLHAVKHMTY